MKKLTLLTLFSIIASLTVRADVIWQELFNYTNGNIIVTSTQAVGGVMVTNWIRHSGSGNDAFVTNHVLQNAATGGSPVSRQDDVHRNFPAAYTGSAIPIYYSFILNCTNLPNAPGTYFAHVQNVGTSFLGKVFALVGTNLCLPNTFRLGVAGSANSVSAIFPNDLAMNQNYQVVVQWDPVLLFATTLWINPISSSDISVISSDTVTSPGITTNLSFRQASTFGNWYCGISNVVVATTFDEASTNVLASNSVPPSIAYDLVPMTNFVAVPGQISVVANGQGLAGFSYLWYKDGLDFPNPSGNSNVLPFSSPVLTDTGNYSVTVSNNLTGAIASSSTVLMLVTNGPPVITVEPTNQAVFPGKNVTISVTAVGTPTLFYSWSFNGGPPLNADPTTTNTPNLVIDNVQTNNGTTGKYSCLITNAFGFTNTVSNTLSVVQPQTVNIFTLRGFVDPTFFLPTNTSLYYTVTNAVVYTLEVTNASGDVNGGPFTAPPNAEYYVQDSSGAGIAVFVSGGASAQPRQGDIVNVTGPISQFNSLLQFNLTSTDPSQSVTVVGHTNVLPTPVVLPFTFTNGSGGFISVSNVIRRYQSARVTLTNCYFQAFTPGAVFASGSYTLTNTAGNTFTFFLNAANVNIIGQPVPPFAWTITGPMGYFASTTATDRSAGFELDADDYSQIITAAPTPTNAISISGIGQPVLNWNTLPFVGYSVLWSSNAAGPYVPIASNLTFSGNAGSFTDKVNTNLPASFYQISSP